MKATMRKNGLWEVKGVGIDGRRKSFYGRSAEEALSKARGSYGIQEDKTLYSFYASVYLPTVAHRSKNWQAQIGWAMDRYVLPAFADREMETITRQELQAFFNKLGKGLKPASLSRVRIVMSGVFNLAEADDHISKNLVRHVRLPSPQAPTKNTLTPEELHTLVTGCSDRIRPFIVLCGLCGLRAGEALGITRHAIKGGILSVEQQVLQIKGGATVTSQLKTPQSRRQIPIPREIQELIVNSGQISAVWICSDTIGGYITPKNASRDLEEAITETGVPRVTPHELRHTFISIMENELECPPAIVAALAGKVHQGVTAAYSHARPKQLAIWMDKLWERMSTEESELQRRIRVGS